MADRDDNLPDLQFDDDLPELAFDDEAPKVEKRQQVEFPTSINTGVDTKASLAERVRAFREGLSEGTPLSGLADKAGAAIQAGLRNLTEKEDKPIGEHYNDALEFNKKRSHELRSKSPTSAAAGEMTAGFAAPTAKGGVLSRMGQAFAVNTADRAVKENDKDSALSSGLFGGTLAAVIEGTVPQAKSIRKAANSRAVKSLDPIVSQQELLQNKGTVQDLGQELLDNKVVRFGSDVDSIWDRLKGLLDKKGSRLGQIRDEVSKNSDKIDISNMGSRGGHTRPGSKADMMDALAESSNEAEGQMARAYRRNADRYLKRPHRSVNELQDEIMSLNNQIPFKKSFAERSPTEKAMTELRGDFSSKMDDAVTAYNPKLGAEHKKLMQDFSLFKDAEGVLNKSTARAARNQDISLKDATLLSTGGPLGAAAAVANKLGRERGNAALAVTLDKVARVLEKTPEKLGKFGPVLRAAAAKGNKSLAATHYLLSKDPEYQALLEGEGANE